MATRINLGEIPLQVRPDALDYQLDLFDMELNRLKGLKFQRDKIKSYHYGKRKKNSNPS